MTQPTFQGNKERQLPLFGCWVNVVMERSKLSDVPHLSKHLDLCVPSASRTPLRGVAKNPLGSGARNRNRQGRVVGFASCPHPNPVDFNCVLPLRHFASGSDFRDDALKGFAQNQTPKGAESPNGSPHRRDKYDNRTTNSRSNCRR